MDNFKLPKISMLDMVNSAFVFLRHIAKTKSPKSRDSFIRCSQSLIDVYRISIDFYWQHMENSAVFLNVSKTDFTPSNNTLTEQQLNCTIEQLINDGVIVEPELLVEEINKPTP